MKKIIMLLFLVAVLIATSASAHEIKSIGSLAVLLHMEPQDSPVVGESAQLIFAFTDVSGVFNVKNCDCVVIVKQKDKQLFEENLKNVAEGYGSNAALVNYTFPKKGIYQVAISGRAKSGPQFDSFSLTYNVRIERENLSQSPVNPVFKGTDWALYLYGFAGIVGVIMVILGIKKLKFKKQ